ncbi:MAG: HEAT repeat domain-containing protein, partial [Fimbriimonadaceae bacterium]|nr:HEAT repeat domain-containing protein [Fimbriimonadaceae bacterium]
MKKWSTSTKVTVALVAVLLAWAIGRSIVLSRMAHVIAHQPMTRPAVEATRKLILKKRLARQFKDGTNHAKFMAIRTASTLLGDLEVVEIEGHHLTLAEAAAGAMVEFLSDLELPVRAAAGEALGRMGKPAARPLIDGALTSPDKDVRTNATSALIRIGMVAVPEMIGAVKGGTPTQKVGCARALGQLKTTRAVPALIGALGVKETEVRLAARDALVAMGAAAVQPLIAALAEKSPFTRRHSAEALGELEDLQAGDPLLALFADEHRLVRLAAIYAVGKVKAPQALNPLLANMDDKDREVREAAAVSLGQIGAAAGVPRLIAALRDPIEAVREQAATALGRLAPSDPTQLAQIGDLTRDPDLGTRYSAVLALGQIGNPASIPAV